MRLLRPTWFEINLDAAVDNLRAVRRLVGPGRKIVAVVKADAYGFGSLEMGRAFAAHGADALGVADLADGVRPRDAGLTLPILMYPNALPEAVAGPVVLRPTFRAFKSRLVEVKDLTPRERFAAAAPFPITAAMRLGVIPAGMGDGVHRLNAGEALVRGRRVPILARPSLEHTRLDLTTVPDAVVGDE